MRRPSPSWGEGSSRALHRFTLAAHSFCSALESRCGDVMVPVISTQKLPGGNPACAPVRHLSPTRLTVVHTFTKVVEHALSFQIEFLLRRHDAGDRRHSSRSGKTCARAASGAQRAG